MGISEANGPASSSNYTIRVPLSWARGLEKDQNYQVNQKDQIASGDYCKNVRGFCNQPQPKPTLNVIDQLAQNGYNTIIIKVDKSSNAATVAKNIRNQFKVGAADAQTQFK